MVAEVYGGGGNSGATLTNDFVELGNAGAAAVDVTGWSVQYLPAAPSPTSLWQVTPLDRHGRRRRPVPDPRGAGAGGTIALPTPDATGTIAMSATAGTVAVVNTTTPLVCRTAADCAADTRIIDLVGYGTAVVRETAPAPATSNTTSAARSSLTDTDNNAADFTRRHAEPAERGGVPPPLPPLVRIHDIQGDGHLSSLAGTAVRAPGVVTAVRAFGSARGFWMQDPEPDALAATSEGIFVFTASTTPAVQPGDAVTVTGTVTEFYPTPR